MLEHKGIDYKRVDLPPVVSRVMVRLAGFSGNRVPAIKVDGRKIQGSRNVSRELEVLRPEPPLFPADPEARAAVEEAERWGDEEFQQMPRTISWWALKRHKSDQVSFLEESGPVARLGMPARIAAATSGPIVGIAIRLNDSTDETVRSDVCLDRAGARPRGCMDRGGSDRRRAAERRRLPDRRQRRAAAVLRGRRRQRSGSARPAAWRSACTRGTPAACAPRSRPSGSSRCAPAA